MQFDNQKTRNVADVVAKILAGESAQQKPQMLEEELVGNQHKIDANKNNKIDAHDFKMLRKKKKVEEETELSESHFKVGDKVRCKESGMDGEIIKLDKEDGGEDEKYYTFKREDGKVMKKAPNELSKINEEVDKKKKDLPFTPDATKKPVRNSDGTIQNQ
jgi:preprotein translocase subunit YajC